MFEVYFLVFKNNNLFRTIKQDTYWTWRTETKYPAIPIIGTALPIYLDQFEPPLVNSRYSHSALEVRRDGHRQWHDSIFTNIHKLWNTDAPKFWINVQKTWSAASLRCKKNRASNFEGMLWIIRSNSTACFFPLHCHGLLQVWAVLYCHLLMEVSQCTEDADAAILLSIVYAA